MTEAEWLACADPRPMVLHLGRQPAGERKLRYFAFACVRRMWDEVPAEPLKRAIEAGERHADGLIDEHELGAAITAANRARPSRHPVARAAYDAARYTPVGDFSGVHWDSVTMLLARAAASRAVRNVPPTTYMYVEGGNVVTVKVPMNRARRKWEARRDAESAAQCDLIREVFGNPFRPVTPDPAWRTPAVVALAETIYNGRAFHRLPDLAAALERAGCADADVLSHCRDRRPHVRGCWVVDLVLDRA
jgi:hypothetical protein